LSRPERNATLDAEVERHNSEQSPLLTSQRVSGAGDIRTSGSLARLGLWGLSVQLICLVIFGF
jgi:hypothetical protein